MINKKIVASLIVAISFIGCGENKEEQKVVTATATTQEVKQEAPKKDEPIIVEKKVEEIKKEEPKVVASKEPKDIYVKCSSCHGQKAEKSALGKSQIIADWSEKEIKNALFGYKNGTYGGVLKKTMQGQVSGYSDEELMKLSNYIATLKNK